MANELARREDVGELKETARLLALSGYFDAKGGGEQQIAQIATKILAGRELGYGPFASVNGIHVIQGKPAISANLIAAAIKASPKYDYRVRQLDDAGCKIEYFERVGGRLESIGIATFTAEDARKAGTQNMQKFGRNMMFARCMTNGQRWYCPDVFSGNAVYTPEEMGAPVDGNGNVIEGEYRTVDPATGEIKDEPPAPERKPEPPPAGNQNGNGQSAPTKASAALLKRLHAVGHEVYGAEWDAKRHAMVSAVSKGRTTSSADLTADEAAKLIAGIEAKRGKPADPPPPAPPAEPEVDFGMGEQPDLIRVPTGGAAYQ